MLKNARVRFFTLASAVQILAGEIFGLVTKMAFVAPVTVVCHEELAQFCLRSATLLILLQRPSLLVGLLN